MTVKNYHIIITLASLLLFGCTRRPAGADAEVMEAAAQGDAVAQLKVMMAPSESLMHSGNNVTRLSPWH